MPADINIWILGVIGLAAGLLGAMLGVGGGFMIVPILTMMGLPIQFAVGSSLISIVTNAATATGIHMRNHMANLKLGLLLSTTLIPGAIAGAAIAASLSAPMLTVLFSLLLLYVAYYMWPKKKLQTQGGSPPAEEQPDKITHSWLNGTYFDPAFNTDVSYNVRRPVVGLVTSFFGGMVSSMFGIGGGIINVPVLSQVMKVPVKATVATSALLLLTTTMTGSLLYIYHGFLIPYVAGPLCLSVFLGARLGSVIAHRTHPRILIFIFSFFMVIMAVLMILRALHVYGG